VLAALTSSPACIISNDLTVRQVGPVPVDERINTCVADLLGRAPVDLCLYLDGQPCLMVASYPDCGDRCSPRTPEAWELICPDDAAQCNLTSTEAFQLCASNDASPYAVFPHGVVVPASLYLVPAATALQACRPGAAPTECNGTLAGDAGCIARFRGSYEVRDEEPALLPQPEADLSLGLSGLFLDDIGLSDPLSSACPSIPDASCPTANTSCVPVTLEVRVEGSGTGVVQLMPRGDLCEANRCNYQEPRGREVTLQAMAHPGAVLASLDSALGAGRGCTETFTEATTTATCSTTLTGDGLIEARFGYALSVSVRGIGSVIGNPGGIDGDGILCTDNRSCAEVYDETSIVTLQAVATIPEWPFSQWTSGACSGLRQPTCMVRMDQAHSVTALFGRTLTVTMTGDGGVTTMPSDQSCARSPCLLSFEAGETATLVPTAHSHSVFARWSDACQGEPGARCVLTMDSDKAVGVHFAYEVETSAAVPRTGSVSRAPAGLDCAGLGAEQCGAYEALTPVTLSGVPAPNYVFLDWAGCSATAGTDCLTTITAPRQVEARFGRQLALSISAGTGTVQLSEPVHGTCGAMIESSNTTRCWNAYQDGQMVTLFASPAANFAVGPASWAGCTPHATDPRYCDVRMEDYRQVDLHFGRNLDVRLTGQGAVASNPAGIGCGVDCSEVFDDGVTVTLVATPLGGSLFDGWTGCDVGGSPDVCSVSMTRNVVVVATFGYEVVVAVVGGGSVTSSPAGISCPGQCSDIVQGTSLVLTATPYSGWAFMGWPGCPSASGNVCTVPATGAAAVSAEFGRSLNVNLISAPASGSVTGTGIDCGADCDEIYANNTQVTLTAQPAAGFTVSDWVGCDSESATQCVVGMDRARTVAVEFGPNLNVSVTGQGTVNSTPGGISCQTSGAGTCAAAFPLELHRDPGRHPRRQLGGPLLDRLRQQPHPHPVYGLHGPAAERQRGARAAPPGGGERERLGQRHRDQLRRRLHRDLQQRHQRDPNRHRAGPELRGLDRL
jgi:hypothetical protein